MTLNETIQVKVQEAINRIRCSIESGFSREESIERMRKSSTLGPKTWAQVLASV